MATVSGLVIMQALVSFAIAPPQVADTIPVTVVPVERAKVVFDATAD